MLSSLASSVGVVLIAFMQNCLNAEASQCKLKKIALVCNVAYNQFCIVLTIWIEIRNFMWEKKRSPKRVRQMTKKYQKIKHFCLLNVEHL